MINIFINKIILDFRDPKQNGRINHPITSNDINGLRNKASNPTQISRNLY